MQRVIIMENIHKNSFYPEIIKKLPEADIPFNGLKGYLAQGSDYQIVFFEIEPIGKVPEHSHKAQWGVVLEGEMELKIGQDTKTYKKGDTYYIPDDVLHSADFKQKTWVMDFFDEKGRYKAKE